MIDIVTIIFSLVVMGLWVIKVGWGSYFEPVFVKICFHGIFSLLESRSDQVDETDREDRWKCFCSD